MKKKSENIFARLEDMNQQINFEGNNQETKEFVKFLVDNANILKIDILDCTISFARQSSDKTAEEVINMIDDSFCGIKIVKEPLFKLNEYEKWEGGYIEGFLRVGSDPDYFIWTYHKMDKLDLILNKLTK